jgi:predicted type IV restriction endonuclease
MGVLTLFSEEKKDYDWVCKVMLSCVTLEQIRNSYELVNLFYRKHSNLTRSSALIGLSVEVEQKIQLNEITN